MYILPGAVANMFVGAGRHFLVISTLKLIDQGFYKF